MKIAIPLADGNLCMHFGHCEQFALIEVDEKERKILNKEFLTPPPHEPGLLPVWLGEKGANLVIAGGMGARAQKIFTENGIEVIVGASEGAPEDIATSYLEGTLVSGTNACDH